MRVAADLSPGPLLRERNRRSRIAMALQRITRSRVLSLEWRLELCIQCLYIESLIASSFIYQSFDGVRDDKATQMPSYRKPSSYDICVKGSIMQIVASQTFDEGKADVSLLVAIIVSILNSLMYAFSASMVGKLSGT